MHKWLLALALVLLPAVATAQSSEPTILRPITNAQIMPYSSASLTITARSFNGGPARLFCTTDCYVAIASAPVVTATTGMFLYQNTSNMVLLRRGDRVAVIRSTADGTLHVQEMGR